jgi:hypothetical protein
MRSVLRAILRALGLSDPKETIDIAGHLDALAEKRVEDGGDHLEWRTSIVDLMKLVGLDSSYEVRKRLAQELNYPDSIEDSQRMNIWLHAQVMQKLHENGGRVPQELMPK